MKHRAALLMIVASMACASPSWGQLAPLSLPGIGVPDLREVTAPLDASLGDIDTTVHAQADQLLRLRERAIERLVRDHPDAIEFDRSGAPARRGVLLVMDADAASLAKATAEGFRIENSDVIAGLDVTVVRLAVPAGQSLAAAQARLEALLPQASVSADTLHFAAGTVRRAAAPGVASAPMAAIATPVGVIDGGPGTGSPVAAVRGFAAGAPRASDHASAIVSLLAGAGVRDIRLADVYGADPAGGNALAIARALGWLVESGSRVVSISLVGSANPVLARAIGAARQRGVAVVAPVGNDGPAAPPAFPASYPGVVSVTGVDRRERALFEAGRALHLDYAAPGTDITARTATGRLAPVRGTSFSAPLVAARLAAALAQPGAWQPRLDAEAVDLGPRGPDATFGRGLLCGACRTPR